MTTKITTITEKLITIQKVLKVPKSQRNKFGGYNYRSLEDITEAVKPLLAEHGLLLNMNDEIVLIGERYYVKSTVSITDGKDKLFATGFARESLVKKGMDESQITGASSSYSRKYAANGLFGIDDAKDADSMDNTQDDTPKKTTEPRRVGTQTKPKTTVTKHPATEDAGKKEDPKPEASIEEMKASINKRLLALGVPKERVKDFVIKYSLTSVAITKGIYNKTINLENKVKDFLKK